MTCYIKPARPGNLSLLLQTFPAVARAHWVSTTERGKGTGNTKKGPNVFSRLVFFLKEEKNNSLFSFSNKGRRTRSLVDQKTQRDIFFREGKQHLHKKSQHDYGRAMHPDSRRPHRSSGLWNVPSAGVVCVCVCVYVYMDNGHREQCRNMTREADAKDTMQSGFGFGWGSVQFILVDTSKISPDNHKQVFSVTIFCDFHVDMWLCHSLTPPL